MTYEEALKVVFPLLDGKDLASCMLICKQWRDIARDDFFWKCSCAKQWPSICKRPIFPTESYHKLFQIFSKCQLSKTFLPPTLSFNDLEFYIDIWAKVHHNKEDICEEERLIFSEVIPGSVFQRMYGILRLPDDIYHILSRNFLHGVEYRMIIPFKPEFNIPLPRSHGVSVSVFVGRRETNEVACIVRKTVLDNFLENQHFACVSNYLNFATPLFPFQSSIQPLASLLMMEDDGGPEGIDILGIELDLDCSHTGKSEEDVLWLLSMLDWD